MIHSVMRCLAGSAEDASGVGGTDARGEVKEDAETSAEGVNGIKKIRIRLQDIEMNWNMADNLECSGVKEGIVSSIDAASENVVILCGGGLVRNEFGKWM